MSDMNSHFEISERDKSNQTVSETENEFSKAGQERISEKEARLPNKEHKPKHTTFFQKILSIVSEILFWGLCLLIIGGSITFALSDDPQKSFFGYRSYNVLTASMTPAADGTSPPGGFRKGDMIIVKLCHPEEVQIDDIITFNPNTKDDTGKTYLTHRVVEVKYEMGGTPGIYFITKGDANNSPDPPIDSGMLIGKKVFHVPYLGTVLQMVRENFALSIIMILSFFSLLFVLKWYFSIGQSSSVTNTKIVTQSSKRPLFERKTKFTMRTRKRKR